MAFGGGDGVRYSPLSGGSKLNNSTCSVETFFFRPPLVQQQKN